MSADNDFARGARIKAVHTACRHLGLDEETRHALQRELTGKESLARMSYRELGTVLDHLNRRPRQPDDASAPAPERIAACPQLQKIAQLLAQQGLPWVYLHRSARGPSMCRRLAGAERIEWADAAGKRAVIVALIKRGGKPQAGA